MRDLLCKEEALIETIELNTEFNTEDREEIISLMEDEKNGVKRYPRENKEIIVDAKAAIFRRLHKMIRAKYSLGMECQSIEEDYAELVQTVSEIGWEKIGYVHFIQIFSLGILLEAPEEQLNKLVWVADDGMLDDCLLDFLVSACGLKREISSKNYQEETPYKGTEKIIGLSRQDREAASKELEQYMKKKWLQGHSGYGWKNAHNEPGYLGFWSFETAALAKILGLKDDALKEDNHYPYDLAHYKHEKVFSDVEADFHNHEPDSEAGGETVCLQADRDLEEIIPDGFRMFINEMITDYQKMEDVDFWSKYNLRDIWYFAEEFSSENKDKNILGALIVHVLADKGYILQLDYKEDLSEHALELKNYWGDKPVKRVRFVLDNDQNYYALVPEDALADTLYEVLIEEAEEIALNATKESKKAKSVILEKYGKLMKSF